MHDEFSELILIYTLQVSDDKQVSGDKALDTKRTDNNKNEKSVSIWENWDILTLKIQKLTINNYLTNKLVLFSCRIIRTIWFSICAGVEAIIWNYRN